MKLSARSSYIEILPAAYLRQRKTWQSTARSLPVGAYLLVTNPNDLQQTRLMQTLARYFRDKGRQVFLWRLDPGTPHPSKRDTIQANEH